MTRRYRARDAVPRLVEVGRVETETRRHSREPVPLSLNSPSVFALARCVGAVRVAVMYTRCSDYWTSCPSFNTWSSHCPSCLLYYPQLSIGDLCIAVGCVSQWSIATAGMRPWLYIYIYIIYNIYIHVCTCSKSSDCYRMIQKYR